MRTNKIDELLKLSKMVSSGEWYYEMYYNRIDLYDDNRNLIAEFRQDKQSQIDVEFICMAKKLLPEIEKKLKGEKK
jgi:hypothetical protein